MRQENNNNEEKNKSMLTFLKETKEGKYAPIDEESLEYVRMQDEQDDIAASSEEFYYSMG